MCVTACLGTFSRRNLCKCSVMCVTAWLWSFVCVPSSLFQMHGQDTIPIRFQEVVMCVTECRVTVCLGTFSRSSYVCYSVPCYSVPLGMSTSTIVLRLILL